MRSQSLRGAAVGALAFVIGLIGYVFFGWRFSDGTDSPVAFVIALVAVVAAIAFTLRD